MNSRKRHASTSFFRLQKMLLKKLTTEEEVWFITDDWYWEME